MHSSISQILKVRTFPNLLISPFNIYWFLICFQFCDLTILMKERLCVLQLNVSAIWRKLPKTYHNQGNMLFITRTWLKSSFMLYKKRSWLMKIEYLQDDFATARHNKTKTQHCTVIFWYRNSYRNFRKVITKPILFTKISKRTKTVAKKAFRIRNLNF